MSATLDIAPLRSLVAVADCGGFGRAADALHLSQSAVSQHVRRLERVVGKPVVVRRGRGTEFTPAGIELLAHARLILAAHDGALLRLVGGPRRIVLGSTEHGAQELLPVVAGALVDELDAVVTYRLDKGAGLTEGLASGQVDVALLLGAPRSPEDGRVAADLPLHWVRAAGAPEPEPGAPVPLVALDEPCLIREWAVGTLRRAGRTADVQVSSASLSGVLLAVRGGLGVAALVTSGPLPDGLERCTSLPPLEAVPLRARAAAGGGRAQDVVVRAVAAHLAQTPAATAVPRGA
ncbi:LysR family transcriptional regulator [Cellulomonas fimi]|uniref:LysR family transcriptional regulator n=1 Tax=Cellulomonas fimi TaxID=1708 RepID=A0A7Y0LYC7_CELFI|nr:LysR family transcriptional regulator [Cellulomonas fimi]NMR20502.1 LysR family transcriptional regulator [Cellulomonas fimi]